MSDKKKELKESTCKDLEGRFPKKCATQRRRLSDLVACALQIESSNLMELLTALDGHIERRKARRN